MDSGNLVISSKISLKQIEYFVRTVQAESMTRAAHDLNITTSALSQQLQSLETALGHRLLVRGGSGLSLTIAGHSFFDQADRALAATERAWDMGSSPDVCTDRVVIGTFPTISHKIIPLHVATLSQRYGISNIEIRTYKDSKAIYAALNRSSIDIAVTTSLDAKVLQKVQVGREECIIACRRSVRISHGVCLSDLASQPWVGYTRQSTGLNEIFEKVARQSGILFNVVAHVSDVATALSMVEAGVGMALIPASGFRGASQEIIFARPNPTISNPVYLCSNELTDKGSRVYSVLSELSRNYWFRTTC
ncbi:LysR family transcriptional regulator [Rhodococcus qingshengii]|uniref:LysR family transcriptional regulator n=1 Tax=Rhodococcus qingshengii TaxID=334542 RepID=A0AAW6LSP8_RHOSG|nr:LysR family transcriptional regulator [Rhodococcus qingshengii]MDE8647468.1 LysR family transcriptional regulator [Rhodococcus qingshengii]